MLDQNLIANERIIRKPFAERKIMTSNKLAAKIFDIMDRKIDTGFGLLMREINKLSDRMERVVTFAIRDELKIDEINE